MEYGLVLWWLVAYLAFMAVGMPLAAVLFPRLADRGAGVALPTALAVLWVVVYLVGHLSLTAGLYVGLALLAVAAVAAVYRGVEIDRQRYAEAAAVFTLAFLFMIAIRAVDAGVHPLSGEKFLDFGLMKSILRAEALPPEDMWFAGRPVEYYYGGHLLAAVLTRMTGTEGRFAYNLALAGFYGMLVTAAYGLAGSIAASRDVSRVRAGAFGAFFVGFASNLATVGHVLSRGVGYLTADDGFWYWPASRVIEGTINEFPLFAWLNGDMHAHMMSTPFVLLVVGLLFSYYRTPEEEVTRRRLLAFGAVPPIGALLAVVNTWSFPTVGGLVFLTLALAPADPLSLASDRFGDRVRRRGWRDRELGRHGAALAGAIVVVALGLLWSLPFWLGTASGRSIGFFPDRSSLDALLTVHGAFVLVFAIHLFRHAVPHLDRDHADEFLVMLALAVLLAASGGSAVALALLGPMILIGWILLRVQADTLQRAAASVADSARGAVPDGGTPASGSDSSTTTDRSTSGGAGGAGSVAGAGRRVRDALGYETVLLIAGAGIVVLVEFAYVKEQAGPDRLNTVFKTYADVWVIWAVAAGAALTHLIENDAPSLALSGEQWRSAMRLLAVALVLSTSIYGVFALSNHFADDQNYNPHAHPDDPTIDGLRFVDVSHSDEAEAITWFDSLDGQPNIVEAPGTDTYSWTNPVSSLTGVPTLAGWAHERGYRGGDVYESRRSDVRTIYTGSAAQRAFLLDVYDVEYVYVGSNEYGTYTESNIEVFESMDGVTLEEQWGYVRVYRVDREQLNVPEE